MNERTPKDDTNVRILALIIALLAISVFLPALQNDFVNWDDDLFVYNNLNIRSIDIGFFKWIFTTYHTADWFPLTWISHAIDYAVWGLNPIGHHLGNVIIHGLNTFLVVILTIRLVGIGGSRADSRSYDVPILAGAVTGILFGIHPLHVESVAWVSERKDVLYSFFYLLSIWSYIKYALSSREDSGPGSATAGSRDYMLCLLFFILALLSKSMAVTLPLVLIILDIYPLKRLSIGSFLRSQRKVLIEKVPFFVLSLGMAAIAVAANKEAGSLSVFNLEVLVDRIIVAVRALSFYLLKMLWPTDLAPFYPYPKEISFFAPEHLGSFVLVACITIFCMLSWKRQKVFSAAWAYYIVILLPVLGIVASGAQAAADRYTYLSSIGPFILVGLGAGLIYERADSGSGRILSLRKYLLIPLIIVICLLSVTTVKQIKVWKNSMTLWNRQLELYDFYVAYNNRGLIYSSSKKYQQAMADYNKAIELDPESVLAYNSRGNLNLILEQYQEAIADFDKAIELDPDTELYNNRGIVYAVMGDYRRALKDFTTAVEIDSRYAAAYENRGRAYKYLGDNAYAERDFRTAERLRETGEGQ